MSTEQTQYEIFLSYSRADNQPAKPGAKGWVTALRDHILADHRRFSTAPLRIFLDESEIADMDDWRHRILGALKHSKILLVCLSPCYFASPYCRWEWEEYLRRQVHQLMGADSIASVYFVEVPGSDEQANAHWLDSVTRGNFTDIRPWFPEGAEALQREEVRRRMAKLGQSLWQRIQRARRAEGVPGNLRLQNPYFVGRDEELRRLHEQLATGAVGLVTAVHGLGGQGKTELAVACAHGFADSYPAGLWVLGAEGKKDLLPLIGELAYAPELGYRPTDAERNQPALLGRAVLAELQRRASAAHERDPDGGAAALLILDNVSDAALLSPVALATLPRADWLRIVATTRLGQEQLHASQKSLAFVRVDSLAEADALALVRDHQEPRDAWGLLLREVPNADPKDFVPRFSSPAEEAAAREIVRELGGFTLAVEQVAVYLGLHPEIAPSAFLAGLRQKGLPSADELARHSEVQAQLLHQKKQLSLILDATLAMLDEPAKTALGLAALLPPDSVPWPWLAALTLQSHPELTQFAPDEPDPWLAVRRRLEGLRLLTSGDHPELARIHRLVAAHLAERCDRPALNRRWAGHLTARASAIYELKTAPEAWELDAIVVAIPNFLTDGSQARDLAHWAMFLSDQIMAYRSLPVAKRLIETTHPVFVRLAGSDPSNAVWQRDLSVSQEKVGDVLSAQGDLAGALRAYRESLAVRQRLAGADPSNVGWQRDLSVSQEKVGDVLSDQGDLAGALRAYRESLAVRQRLTEADPSNAGWQRDLSVSQDGIGDVLRAQGDLAGALRAYRESLAVRQRLAGSDPSNAGWQRNLSASQDRIGDVLRAQGDLAGALRAYRESLAVSQRLAGSDPSNAGWQRNLSASQDRIGLVLSAQGDLAGALRAYRESLAVSQRLAGADPSNAGWQRDLSVSQDRIGDVLRAQGDLAGALRAYRESLAVSQRLAGADPSNAGWQRDLWISCCKMADISERSGAGDAMDWWRKAYTQISSMKERGILLATDEPILDQLRLKLGTV